MTSPPRLSSGVFYHIYDRGVNRENVFVEVRNCSYFLDLYGKHVAPVVDTYAYCLLKNHFHLLVRTKDEMLPAEASATSLTASAAFSNFLNAYVKAFNTTYGRTGSLFQHPFGRVAVHSQTHLLQLVRYIHINPQKHGLIDDFRVWPYSSWFDGVQGFVVAHQVDDRDERAIGSLAPDDL
jgi:REP element-mobilizing transposase RayT